jgi:hypothetical protein
MSGPRPMRPLLVAVLGRALFPLIFYAMIGAVVVVVHPQSRAFLVSNKTTLIPLGIFLLLVIALLVFMKPTRQWLREGTAANRQGAALTFVVVPALLGVVIGITFTPPSWQLFAFRVGFILVAGLLPAVLYYLFIVTRKESLFNEFVVNMTQLGHLGSRRQTISRDELHIESDAERTRRVLSYLQKFEAVYGPVQDEAKEEVLQQRKAIGLGRVTFTTVFASEAAVPVLIATFLMALMWVVTLPPVRSPNLVAALLPSKIVDSEPAFDPGQAPWRNALTPNLSPVTAAFLGAYFFSLQLLFRRYVRRDIRPSAYVGSVLRMLLVVIGIWVIQWLGPLVVRTETRQGLIVLAFTIGVFPRVLLQVIEAALKKLVPSAVLPSLQSDLPISDLDGLTVWHEARLEDEDIENMPNMASADILELMLNTRFSPDRLVDWVDQAILYTALGPSLDKKATNDPRLILRGHGIRTATALIEAQRRSADLHKDVDAFEQILDGAPRRKIRSLIDAVEQNPNIPLIQAWRSVVPSTTSGALRASVT